MQGPVRYIEKHDKKNVIYFNNDLDDMEKVVADHVASVMRINLAEYLEKGIVK